MSRKYSSPYYQVLRAKVILLSSEGLENTEIGICQGKSLANGENVFSNNVWMVSKICQGRDVLAICPPEIIVEIKALACELPFERQIPFSRLNHADIAQEAINSGIVTSISGATAWRWLSTDAIKPWYYRCWLFPRDPNFAKKAGIVLDLYHRIWKHKPL